MFCLRNEVGRQRGDGDRMSGERKTIVGTGGLHAINTIFERQLPRDRFLLSFSTTTAV